MATDYDAPRKNDDEPESDSIEELTARQKDQSSEAIEEDENEVAEAFVLPGADLSRVLPGSPSRLVGVYRRCHRSAGVHRLRGLTADPRLCIPVECGAP